MTDRVIEDRAVRALEKIANQLVELNRINSAWHEYEQQRQAKADELQQAILAPMMGVRPTLEPATATGEHRRARR